MSPKFSFRATSFSIDSIANEDKRLSAMVDLKKNNKKMVLFGQINKI
jgi:hypothetical protein